MCRTRTLTSLVVLAVTIMACDNVTPPEVGNYSPYTPSSSLISRGLPVGLDDRFADVAQAEPAFGGMFRRGNELHVYLTDTTKLGNARRAILEVFHERSDFQTMILRPVSANFSFMQLYNWKRRLNAVAGVAGVLSLDIDDFNNRLKVGVDNVSIRGTVAKALEAAAIPLDATSIEWEPQGVAASTLDARWRNIGGGLRVESPSWKCSIGFSANRAGVESFATNGHCSNSWGSGSESSLFYQCCRDVPTDSIGREYLEAALFSQSADWRCPTSEPKCKYNDILLGRYQPSSGNHEKGLIMRTLNRQVTRGSLYIDMNHVYLYITATSWGPIAGDIVDKIGQTSGWTYGPVTDVDKHELITGPDGVTKYWIIGMDWAAAGVLPGDSGSPVFTWDGGTNVMLQGQLHSRKVNAFTASEWFGFSVWNFIVGDPSIGQLTVTYGS